jgi:hypothetical protein
MTPIVSLVRAWLVADPGVGALCGPRVASSLDAKDGFPAVVIGAVSGGPQAIASAQVDAVERWSVALYVYGGRMAGGASDLPNSPLAWNVAQSVAAATGALTYRHFAGPGGRLVSGRVVSAAPGVDFDTGSARTTLTLELVAVRAA